MTTPDFPRLHPHYSSATGGEPSEHAAATDPNALVATLHRIGKGAEAEYVGDRVMEGLIMACLAMNAQASARMRPEG